MPDAAGIRRSPLRFAALILILLAGCTLGPEYQRPDVALPDTFKHGAESSVAAAPPQAVKWWSVFDDVLMDELISNAMTDNFDLKAALYRVDQARAVARYQGSYRYPTVGFEPSYQKGQASKTSQLSGGGVYANHSLPVTSGWELDLFGKIQRGYEAGLAEAEAAAEDLAALRLLIQTDIAVSYLAMRSLDEELSILNRTVEVRTEQLKILRNRFEAGVISRLPLEQADAELRATEALRFSVERERAKLENAIAILTGKPPSDISLRFDPLRDSPPEIPGVIPSALLTERPDIRRAERILAAENARIGVAEANFFPQVQISANIGYASGQIEDLIKPDSFIWSFMPSLRLPIFEGGRNQAELDRAKARYAEVVELYRLNVIRAIGEVEDALVSVDLLQKQAAANELAVKSAMKAYQLSKKQFEGGLVNYLTVLDTERTYLDNLRLASQLRGQRYLSAVQLIKAIGGRWM